MKALFTSIALAGSLTLSEGIQANPTQSHCLALNIYHEARMEPLEGWLTVALVTRNRMEMKGAFGDTWCEVVYSPWAFSWTNDQYPDEPDLDDPIERRAWERIKVFTGGFMASHKYIKDTTEGAVDYARCDVDNYWTRAYKMFRKVGRHCIYHR